MGATLWVGTIGLGRKCLCFFDHLNQRGSDESLYTSITRTRTSPITNTLLAILGAEAYFAHPYSSWARATNENTNGLMRQHFPKKHDFDTITEKDTNRVPHRLNNRPRSYLRFKSPDQLFFSRSAIVALGS